MQTTYDVDGYPQDTEIKQHRARSVFKKVISGNTALWSTPCRSTEMHEKSVSGAKHLNGKSVSGWEVTSREIFFLVKINIVVKPKFRLLLLWCCIKGKFPTPTFAMCLRNLAPTSISQKKPVTRAIKNACGRQSFQKLISICHSSNLTNMHSKIHV